MKISLTGLWLQANFRKLWAGQATSLLGSNLATVVMPLTAVMVLGATPIQMGILTAMRGVPALIGLFLGVWVDRRRRGPIMVMVDVGRAMLLLLIPVTYLLDILSIEVLYAVSLGIGAMSMLFEITYRSFLPSVVLKSELVEANSKLELANSGSTAIGPGIGGALVELVTAPFALVFSVVMYLVSALMFRSLRVDEPSVPHGDTDESVLAQIRAGLGYFRSNRTLFGLSAAAGSVVFWGMAYDALFILYMVENLEFTAGMIGLVFSLGSLGLLMASFVSSRLNRIIGLGPTLVLGFMLMGAASFILPLVSGERTFVFLTVIFAEVTFMLGVVVWNIGQVSLRQAITPENLLGRVTSLAIVISRTALPLGALFGGFMGEFLGLRVALFVFAGGVTLSAIWLVVFGVWKIRVMPGISSSNEEVPVSSP